MVSNAALKIKENKNGHFVIVSHNSKFIYNSDHSNFCAVIYPEPRLIGIKYRILSHLQAVDGGYFYTQGKNKVQCMALVMRWPTHILNTI